jgi:hypothetical protein
METSTSNTASVDNYSLKEPPHPTSIALKEFSAFFITTTTLPKLGSKKGLDLLRPGLYGFQREKRSEITEHAAEFEGVILIPGREVTQRSKSLKGTKASITDRRYVLVTFYPFKEATLRQKANRLAWRIPLIPIRPGLLISPHIRAIRFRQYEKVLLRPSEYVRRMIDLGKTIWYAPKLKLLRVNQEQILEGWIKETFEERAAFILNSCKTLLQEAKADSPQSSSNKKTKRKLSLLRKRLQQMRAQSLFFDREFGFDYSSLIQRVAAKLSRVRQKVMNT